MSRPHSPAHVVAAVRDAYLGSTLSVPQIAAQHGLAVKTVERWRVKFGWKLRKPQSSSTPQTFRAEAHPDTRPKRWRCCDRVNTGPQCETCGRTPDWAA